MRITVLGAGALGGYFGARLQAAGQDVTYVARGAHLEAMQADGLRVESPLGDLRLESVRAVATPAEAGEADVVLFMVKNYDVEAAAETLAPTLGSETMVLSVQNGVLAHEHLAKRLGAERVLPGPVYMPADLKAPGVVRHSAEFHGISLGALESSSEGRAREVADVLASTGVDVTVAEDIRAVLWEKVILMAPNSAITALTRLDIGPIRAVEETRALLRQLIDEAFAIGRAEHPGVPQDAAEKAFRFLMETVPPTMHASMQDDLVRGKRLELDWLSGDLVRRGERLGIATPAHRFAYAALKPFAEGGV